VELLIILLVPVVIVLLLSPALFRLQPVRQ
jgi:hypothetical protein